MTRSSRDGNWVGVRGGKSVAGRQREGLEKRLAWGGCGCSRCGWQAEGGVGPQAGEAGGATLGRALIAWAEAGNPIQVQTRERS